MPIYEYVCEACGRLTEVMQRMSDPPPATCPACGGPKLSKVVSRTSFQLKGGGWYADLYASPKEKKAGDTGGSGSGSATPGTSAPATSAPATTPAGGGTSSSGSGSAGSSGSSGGSGTAGAAKPSGGAA